MSASPDAPFMIRALLAAAVLPLPATGADASGLLLHEHGFLGLAEHSHSGGVLEGSLVSLMLLTVLILVCFGALWRRHHRKLVQESASRQKAETALHTSKELLAAIITANTDGMLVLSEEGRVLLSNPSAATLLGDSQEALMGHMLGLFSGLGRCELELPRGDGSPRIVEASVIPMDWRGEPSSLLCLRDVTQEREAEARLSQSEALLQSTFHSMQDLVLVIDRKHRIRLSNWRGLEHLPQEVRESQPHCYTLFHGRDTPCPDCNLPEVFATGKTRTTERTVEINGRIYEESVSPMPDATGRVEKVVKHMRDVTEHRIMQKEVEQSERLYRLIAENMPNGAVHMFDQELRYVISEGSVLAELGLDGDAMLGRKLGELLPPETVEVLEPCYRAALRGEASKVEISLQERIFEVRTLPLEDGEGRVIAGMVVSQEITDRKRREQELQASEARFRAVFDNAAVGVCILDREGRFMSTNDAYSAILGYSAEEFLELGYLDVTARHDRDAYAEHFRELLEGSRPSLFLEKDNIRKDASLVPVRVGVSTVPGADGRPQYLVGVMEDISDRRRAELSLASYRDSLERRVDERTQELAKALDTAREAREQVDLILRSVGEGLMVTDLQNRVLLMNRPAEELLCVEYAELAGRTLEDFVSLDVQGSSCREAFCEHIENAKNTSSYQFDFIMPDQAGVLHTLHARTSVVLDASGRQTGLVTIISDVTRERETDRMKSEFISTAAHELRTPLTSIQGYSELMVSREDMSAQSLRSFAGKINTGALRLRAIVDDLLDISRIESGKGFSFNRQSVNIMELVERKIAEYQARHQTHTFAADLPSGMAMAWLDEGRMEQVLENILSNAVKYSPQGGEILVRCLCGSDHCELEVRDQGLGMTSEQLKHVFDKFYRAHAEGGAIQGTGLGMSIVKYIVEHQGGTVWLESAAGAGTSVYFTLPLLSSLEQVHADIVQAGPSAWRTQGART